MVVVVVIMRVYVISLMKKLSQWPWKNIGLVVLAFLVVGLLFGNGSSLPMMDGFQESFLTSSSKNFSGGARGEMATMAYDMDESAEMGRGIMPPSPEPPGSVAPGAERRELIRTGNLSLIVADVNESVMKIKDSVKSWNGLVEESNVNQMDDDSQSGWMRLRVPVDAFDMAMTSLKNMALKVDSETTRVDDVTGQVVDTEERLRNLRAEEQQYRDILARAETVEETLQATDYLNRVRNEIEWAERSLNDVTERVALSTINVNLIDEGDVEVLGVYWTPWLNVKKAARGALENLTESVDMLVAFVLNLPLILVWLAILWVAVWLGKKGLVKLGLL